MYIYIHGTTPQKKRCFVTWGTQPVDPSAPPPGCGWADLETRSPPWPSKLQKPTVGTARNMKNEDDPLENEMSFSIVQFYI